MGDGPESKEPGNPLRAIVGPLTKLGIDTARDIAAVVESTQAAGRDLLRLANVFSRIPSREPAPIAAAPDDEPDDEALPPASVPAGAPESPPADGPSLIGGLKRAAETALSPAAALGVAVRPAPKKSHRKGSDKKADLSHSDADLRHWGDELIAQSQQPTDKPIHRHPAFEQILKELAPDEVRILRFLAVAGTQPSIDIRTKTMFQIGSERLAGGVNMIAEMAGCRWPEADQRYLANLNRLGLVRFSSEPVADYRRYALLEVQPRALEVTESIPKTISVYRSIYLSEFGQQFCEVCIDTDGYNAGSWATDERGDKIVGKGPPDAAARKHKH
ncbi:Abi-alpha family protein [Mycolicibacterium sp. HS_4_1]